MDGRPFADNDFTEERADSNHDFPPTTSEPAEGLLLDLTEEWPNQHVLSRPGQVQPGNRQRTLTKVSLPTSVRNGPVSTPFRDPASKRGTLDLTDEEYECGMEPRTAPKVYIDSVGYDMQDFDAIDFGAVDDMVCLLRAFLSLH